MPEVSVARAIVPHLTLRVCQHRRMKRIVLGLAALLCIGLAPAAPPPRNLSVEMRVSEEQFDAQRAAQGSVVVGSRGGRVNAGAAVTVQAGSSRQGLDAIQRVLVLNGGRATLQLSQGVQVEGAEIWWTPWGPGAVLRSQWVELVDGLQVQPAWPGGDAPVTLELAVQRRAPLAAPPPGTRAALPAQWGVVTTVQAPLGEWVTVAEVQGRETGMVASGGFGASTATRRRLLQLRVSLP